jgi:hypothetical protein
MAQYGRPSADTYRTGWENEIAASTLLYQSIDESSYNDGDYIITGACPASSIYVTKLTAVTDPLTGASHVINYRYKKSETGGSSVDITIQLRQDYTAEGTPGTLIASVFHSNISSTIVAGSYLLSTAEADAITSYSTLYFRVVGDQP